MAALRLRLAFSVSKVMVFGMNTPHLKGRENNLAEFGWTGRKAEWIALVCLHSGCFLRSQLCYYLQINRMTANRFIRSLIDQGFAVEVTLREKGEPRLCRVSSRQIYRALGVENIRHRREASPRLTLVRLLSLDYVLEHPQDHWLPTEQEKVQCFHSQLKLPSRLLPSRVYQGAGGGQRRYFVGKLPIAQAPDTVTFLYVDPQDLTDKALRLWGSVHQPLWDALKKKGREVRVVAVAAGSQVLSRADRILRDWARERPSAKEEPTSEEEIRRIEQAILSGDEDKLKEWGGLNEALERTINLEEDFLREKPTALINSYSTWHSTRLSGVNIESLGPNQAVTNPVTNTKGGL